MSTKIHILAHTPSSNILKLLSALKEGCAYGYSCVEEQQGEISVSAPLKSDYRVIHNINGIIFLTPENFGYMSGAMKDWFDRSFYSLEGKHQGLPFASCVRAGKDGTGTVKGIESIAKGLNWKSASPALKVKGEFNNDLIVETHDFAANFAAGVASGVF